MERSPIIELRRRGYTYRRIQDELKVPQGVIYDVLKWHTETPEKSTPENPVETDGIYDEKVDTEIGHFPCIAKEDESNG